MHAFNPILSAPSPDLLSCQHFRTFVRQRYARIVITIPHHDRTRHLQQIPRNSKILYNGIFWGQMSDFNSNLNFCDAIKSSHCSWSYSSRYLDFFTYCILSDFFVPIGWVLRTDITVLVCSELIQIPADVLFMYIKCNIIYLRSVERRIVYHKNWCFFRLSGWNHIINLKRFTCLSPFELYGVFRKYTEYPLWCGTFSLLYSPRYDCVTLEQAP